MGRGVQSLNQPNEKLEFCHLFYYVELTSAVGRSNHWAYIEPVITDFEDEYFYRSVTGTQSDNLFLNYRNFTTLFLYKRSLLENIRSTFISSQLFQSI